MTEVPVSDDIKDIEEKIKAGLKWVKEGHNTKTDARWEQWKRNAKYLRCRWDDDWTENKFRAFNVNTIYSNYHVKKPSLYFKNPKVTATPTKPDFTRDAQGNVLSDQNGQPILADNYNAAKLIGVKVNYELREIGFKKILKKVVGDNLCPYGIGWVKWGYKELTVGGHSNERDRKVSYWCTRVDPRNIVYDWFATSMDDCKWIAERIVLSRSEAVKLGFKIPEGYRGSLPDFLEDRNEKAKGGNKSNSDFIVIWEFHDLVENNVRWFLIADKNGGVSVEIKERTENPYPFDGSCYVPLVLDEDNDDIIGLSDVEPVEDQALAINRMRTMQVKQADNFGIGMVYEEGAMSEETMKDFRRTPYGWEMKLKTGMMGKFEIVTPPTLGGAAQLAEVHKDEIRTTLGVTEFQQGDAGNSSTKATTANIVQNSANVRISEQRDVIYDFVIECVRRLTGMIQEFAEESEYLNLKDEELDEDYVTVLKEQNGFNPKIPFLKMSKKDIQGEFNWEFSIEDMINRPKEVQLQQLTNLLQVYLSSPIGTQALEQANVSLAKCVTKSFELAGVDIGELEYGGPQQISSEQENMMFTNGMEVPDPNRKDNNEEHIMSHHRVAEQVQQQIGQVQSQIQMIQQGAVQQAQMVQDPAQVQMLQQQAEEQTLPLKQKLEQLTMMLRKIQLHLQSHDQAMTRKSGGGSGKMPQPQQAANMQTQIQSQAGAIQ